MQNKHKSTLMKLIFVVSIIGMLPLFAALGTKIGIWEPMTGFRTTMRYMSVSSVCTIVALFLIFNHLLKDMGAAIKIFVLCLLFAGVGYLYGVNQEPTDWTGLPGIHDVTTDMESPPEFVTLLDAPGRRNSFDYTLETAERQKAKFPWVKPIISELSRNEAYARSISVASELGWEIAGEDPSSGKFEATDYTKWFQFHDDIVVRISEYQDGSRVDIRSLTRVGGSDHGLGAIRIMKFTAAFNQN